MKPEIVIAIYVVITPWNRSTMKAVPLTNPKYSNDITKGLPMTAVFPAMATTQVILNCGR